ncbi:MAG: molybdopterin dinucleotide binding domain-containing protein [Acidimicrobiales bacterium]
MIDLYQTGDGRLRRPAVALHMQHEQFELHDSVRPPLPQLERARRRGAGSCLPHTEIFAGWQRRWGSDDRTASERPRDRGLPARHRRLPRPASPRATRSDGWVRVPDSSPFRPFADGFKTASRRFEFASSRAEADGQGRVPHYLPAAETTGEPEPGRYRLVSPASEWHINSVFAGTAVNLGRTVAPPVSVHPDDAERDGLVDGQPIVIENQRHVRGRGAGRRPDPAGLAATTKGWWRQGLNATVREQDSDMGGGAVYHVYAVTIRPR